MPATAQEMYQPDPPQEMYQSYPPYQPVQVPQPQPGEPSHAYQGRLLRFVLTYGAAGLTLSELEAADTAAAWSVAQLPAELDANAARLDSHLHAARLQLAARMAEKRRQQAALARMFAEMDDEPPQAGDAPGGAQDAPQAPPESDADRAARLIRAAMLLIMGPQDPGRGGPGSPATLVPPRPNLPPSGVQLRAPQPQAPAPPARRRF